MRACSGVGGLVTSWMCIPIFMGVVTDTTLAPIV